MISPALKQEIQQAYSHFLKAKGLQPRYGQKLMIAEIAKTLGGIAQDEDGGRSSDNHICVVEAGTGTGKTVAYLLAALPVARALNKRVVLATATIALQEQVVLKDVPDVLLHSGLNFSYSLAKGRGRYLCLAKLDRLLSSDDSSQLIPVFDEELLQMSAEDVKLYSHMMDKLSCGAWHGDRDDWEEEISPQAWQRVTTDHRQCAGRKCSHVRQCAFFKARDALGEADLVVANHDLVLADLALGGGAILPPPQETIYIFDEGHHLPDKALNHFSAHLRYRSTLRWLGQSEGQWPNLVAPLEKASYFSELARPMEALFNGARKAMEEQLPLLGSLTAGVDMQQYTPRLRFERGEAPAALEALAQQLQGRFQELVRQLNKTYDELGLLIDEEYPVVPKVDLENLYPVLGAWLARAEAALELWSSYTQTRLDETWPFARWITLVSFNEVVDYELVSSPILAARTLNSSLWTRCFGAVVTSATLTALNSFDRFKTRAGTYEGSTYLSVPSPFNFQQNAVITIPREAVEANDAAAHTDSVIRLLPDIVRQEEGTLVLFASRRQMLDVFDAMPPALRSRILMQGVESKQALVRNHKLALDDGCGSIIFGLSSFAEGVDLPGDYCSHVVIAKIPFAVPDDPLEAALAEWIEARGGNAFMQVSVPDASMRLIQACGRLLRTEQDKGRITVLDRRLISKRYGKALLDALPPFRREF